VTYLKLLFLDICNNHTFNSVTLGFDNGVWQSQTLFFWTSSII